MEALIKGHLHDWWRDEPETQRLDLRDELRHLNMGLPQEVDRQLLLRLSRLLGHPLTWPEKKVMRQAARSIVLGDSDTDASVDAEPLTSAADSETVAGVPVR